MRSELDKLLFRVRTLLRDNGQDLVEYGLILSLIAFAVTAGFQPFAAKLSNAFSNIGATLTKDVSEALPQQTQGKLDHPTVS